VCGWVGRYGHLGMGGLHAERALLITRQKKNGLILRNSPYSSEFLSSRLGVRHLEPDEVVAIPRVLVNDMSLQFDTPFLLVFDSRRPLS